jgi:hypothetical protein
LRVLIACRSPVSFLPSSRLFLRCTSTRDGHVEHIGVVYSLLDHTASLIRLSGTKIRQGCNGDQSEKSKIEEKYPKPLERSVTNYRPPIQPASAIYPLVRHASRTLVRGPLYVYLLLVQMYPTYAQSKNTPIHQFARVHIQNIYSTSNCTVVARKYSYTRKSTTNFKHITFHHNVQNL